MGTPPFWGTDCCVAYTIRRRAGVPPADFRNGDRARRPITAAGTAALRDQSRSDRLRETSPGGLHPQPPQVRALGERPGRPLSLLVAQGVDRIESGGIACRIEH